MYESPKGHRCFIVALEGADRLGKSTQAKLVEAKMEAEGIRGVLDKCPYKDGVTYERIYEMLRTGEAKQHPIVFQTLQGANRRAFQNKLLPTLALHFDVVLIDRWSTSTWVYGTQDGVPPEATEAILSGLVEPDLVYVFDGEQFDAPDADDAYEADKEFQIRVRNGYRQWVQDHDNHHLINANRDKHLICDDLMDGIRRLLR
jgi:thymidylate kinase